MSSFDPGDDWTKLGSISEDTWIYGDRKFGYIEHFTEGTRTLVRHSQTPTTTVSHSTATHSLPTTTTGGDDAFNLETQQIQNWTRSDLDPVDHLDHAPVRDKKTKFDTTINATYGSGGISVDYRIPYIKRNVDYETEEQIKTYYRYPQRIDGHEAKYVDCDHEQISIWRTDPIASDSEAITTSTYWGQFEEYDGTDQTDHTFTLLTLNKI